MTLLRQVMHFFERLNSKGLGNFSDILILSIMPWIILLIIIIFFFLMTCQNENTS
jgi:uncharacterized membrane protein